MSTLDEYFVAALRSFVEKEKSQRAFALKYGVITPDFLSKILLGKKYGSEETRRAIATSLGYEGRKYEDFLDIGRSLVEGKEPPTPEPKELRPLTADKMTERGFIAIPFSEEMKLAAGSGGTIPITDDEDCSPVIVHGPSLNLKSAKNLQAFRVGGDSMEPLIAQNGIVLADLSQSNIMNLHEGKVYVLCWDRDEGECAVKRLRWGDKGKTIIIESEERFYPPVVKSIQDIVLIGRVIWAWREL